MKIKDPNKFKGCNLRKTHPIGPLKMCQDYCHCFDDCVELSREEREAGLDLLPGPYKTMKQKFDGNSRFCSVCGRPIAKATTAPWSFKGMMSIHLQAKHISHFDAWKKGKIRFDQLYHTK
jgi:hypothetical protein